MSTHCRCPGHQADKTAITSITTLPPELIVLISIDLDLLDLLSLALTCRQLLGTFEVNKNAFRTMVPLRWETYPALLLRLCRDLPDSRPRHYYFTLLSRGVVQPFRRLCWRARGSPSDVVDPGDSKGVPHAAHGNHIKAAPLYSILCFRIAMRRFMSGSLYDVSRKLPCSEWTRADYAFKGSIREQRWLFLDAMIHPDAKWVGLVIKHMQRGNSPSILYCLEKIMSQTTCEHGSSYNTPAFALHELLLRAQIKRETKQYQFDKCPNCGSGYTIEISKLLPKGWEVTITKWFDLGSCLDF